MVCVLFGITLIICATLTVLYIKYNQKKNAIPVPSIKEAIPSISEQFSYILNPPAYEEPHNPPEYEVTQNANE